MAEVVVRGVLLDSCINEDGTYHGEHLQDVDGDGILHLVPPNDEVRAAIERFRNATIDVHGDTDLYEGLPVVRIRGVRLVLPAQKPALA
jgi:hypothetical protein